MKLINKIIEYVLAFLVVVMVAGCFWQIFTRFILNDPSKWTEELLRYALIVTRHFIVDAKSILFSQLHPY